MNNGRDDGRQVTLPIRRAEALAVKHIVKSASATAGARPTGSCSAISTAIASGSARWREPVDEGDSGIEPLLEDFAVDPMETLPPA